MGSCMQSAKLQSEQGLQNRLLQIQEVQSLKKSGNSNLTIQKYEFKKDYNQDQNAEEEEEENYKEIIIMESKDQVDTRGSMLILYGTTTGNATKLALSFQTEARHEGFMSLCQNLGDFNLEQLQTHQLVILIVATYGKGDSTFDSTQFLEYIQKQNEGFLKGNSYSVFGLGNSSYDNFCGMGVKTDKEMQRLGAKQICQLGKGNANTNSTEKDFQKWKANIWPILKKQHPFYTISKSQMLEEQSTFQLKFLVSETKEFNLNCKKVINLNQYDSKIQQYFNSKFVQLNDIKHLNIDESNKEKAHCFLIDFEFEEDIKYHVDGNIHNLQIYPQNSQESAKQFAEHMGYDIQQRFEIKMKNQIKKPFPTPISIQSYLINFCDFHGPLSKNQLLALCINIQDQDIRQKYEYMTTFEGDQQFNNEISKNHHSLFSISKLLNIQLSLIELLQIARKPAPRNYTISCSQSMFPKNIHITLTLSSCKQTKYGLTSYKIPLRINLVPSCFNLLPSQNPIILVSTGSGIGPMRAFIQEKQKNSQYGDFYFYYGCRYESDFLYKDEINDALDKDLLMCSRVAYSKPNDGKGRYVQSLMAEDEIQIGELLFADDTCPGKVFLCGGQQMIEDVVSEIGNIYIRRMNLPVYKKFQKIQDMKSNSQIIMEIWK